MSNALEALRIATTFFVLFYHAALTYLATPMRLTLWATYDATGHVAFDYLVYWVNGFAMPVFFLAAGVSAPAACASRGPRAFLTSRVRRLLRPLLFGCLTVVPMFYLVWGYGLLVTGRIAPDNILGWRFNPPFAQQLYGLGHLWFLEYLFLISVLWCGGWALGSYLFREGGWHWRLVARWPSPALRAPSPRGRGVAEGHVGSGPSPGLRPPSPGGRGFIDRALGSAWRPLWFAIPTGLIFLLDSDTMLRVDNLIVPNVFRVLHYTWFFSVGGWLAQARDPRARFVPWSTLYLVLSFVLFGLMSPLLLRHAAAPLEGWERSVYCGLAALFPWLTVFGGLGVFMRVFDGRGTVMRYLAESSFWVYLIHVPIVALVQALLLPVAWPVGIKFLFAAAVAIALSLLSYEFIVRRSAIGEIVNGFRKRSPRRGFFGPEFGWVATLAVAAVLLAVGAWCSRVFFFGNNLHEVIPGKLYRCAKLSTRDLDDLIRVKGLRTVITFTGGTEKHPWYVAQKRVCEARGVELVPISLPADRLPAREPLNQLLDALATRPRPILVQGNRGLDQCGLAAAAAELLAGTPPRVALEQFALRYGQFGGALHSPLGRALVGYQAWLEDHQWPHTPGRFRAWAHDTDLVDAIATRLAGTREAPAPGGAAAVAR
jgi:peptidoglycan/LPS O-acetylase OafA/YrhL